MSCASFRKYGNPAEFCQTVLAPSPSGWVRPLNSRKRRILSQNCEFCWAVIGFWPPWFSHGYRAALHCSRETSGRMAGDRAAARALQTALCAANVGLANFLWRACMQQRRAAVTSYSQLSRTPSFSANWATGIADSTRYLGEQFKPAVTKTDGKL